MKGKWIKEGNKELRWMKDRVSEWDGDRKWNKEVIGFITWFKI